MQQDLYWLDAERIEDLLRKLDKKQRWLARESRVGQRTVSNVVNNERPVSYETAKRLAQGLGVPLVELLPRLAQAPRWQSAVGLDAKKWRLERADLEEAIDADMRGRCHEAVTKCRRILLGMNRCQDVEAYDAVFVRLLTFMDHAADEHGGQSHRDLCGLIARFLEQHDPAQSTSGEWILYQYGICLRKLGEWEQARNALRPLTESRDQGLQVAALHQLAATDIEEASTGRCGKRRESLLKEARGRLRACLDCCREKSVHRAAFSLRRLGELEELCGNRQAALKNYLDALEIFAQHDCQRYAQRTRRDIEILFAAARPSRGGRRQSAD